MPHIDPTDTTNNTAPSTTVAGARRPSAAESLPEAEVIGRDAPAVAVGRVVAAADETGKAAPRPRRGVVFHDGRRPGEGADDRADGGDDAPHQVAVPIGARGSMPPMRRAARGTSWQAPRTDGAPIDLIATAVDDRLQLTPDRTGAITGCMSCTCLSVVVVVAVLAATRWLQREPALLLVPLFLVGPFFVAGLFFRSEWLVIERGAGHDGAVAIRRSVIWAVGHDCGKPLLEATRVAVARTVRAREDIDSEADMPRATVTTGSGGGGGTTTEVLGLVEADVAGRTVVLFRGTELEAAEEAANWRAFLLQSVGGDDDDGDEGGATPAANDGGSEPLSIGTGDSAPAAQDPSAQNPPREGAAAMGVTHDRRTMAHLE